MYQVYACVTQHHDPLLLIAAALVCIFASWTALNVVRRNQISAKWARATLAYAALVAGAGMWATHFLAMLAFDTGLPVGYEVWMTIASVLVAIMFTGAGFLVSTGRTTSHLWAAGVIVGLGLSAAHYTGMASMQVAANKTWDTGLVIASLLVGIALCALALRIGLGGRKSGRVMLGALLLTAAICGLHLIGMAAIKLEPTILLPPQDALSAPRWLGVGIAVVASMILSSGTAMMMGQHFAQRDTARLRALVDATFEGLIIHLDNVILDSNESLLNLIGMPRKQLVGRLVQDLLTPEWTEETRRYLASSGTTPHETELQHADGSKIAVELLSRTIEHRDGKARVIAIRDLSERRIAAEHVNRLAHYDLLTSLPNRVLLRDHMEGALARGRRGGAVAILCVGLDRFKSINDVLGHSAGDAVLRAVAQRLKNSTRETDFVARLGGDEFVIVQEYASQPTQATALARRLLKKLAEPITVDDRSIEIGASIGIAMASDDNGTAETILKNADLALSRAKSEGGASWRFFEEEMDERMQTRWALEKDLRAALAANQFEVYYQPLIETAATRVIGFEALLRWNHPIRGMVPPASFIPTAEEVGLIAQIGLWILERACSDIVAWPGNLKVAVNLSPVQFRNRNLAREVSDILEKTNLDPARLELEVTESLLLGDDPAVMVILHELHDLGVSIAMDDFGTGYSSLSYLRRFPFDKIKIDRCFVSDLVEHEQSRAIVRAIAELGRALAIRVNAEGVETEGQYAVLRTTGCHEVQGFFFSKPKPAAEIPALLQQLGTIQLQHERLLLGHSELEPAEQT